MQTLPDIQKQLAAAEKGTAEWALLQMQLGDVLQELQENPEAQDAAIYAYDQAFSVFRLEVAPVQWAQIAVRKGEACLYRIRGVRSENLRDCIGLSQHALTLLPQSDYQEDWLIARYNIATAWLNLMTGNRSENIEKGIRLFHELLAETLPAENPEHWARVHNQLGTGFLARIKGERADNLEIALTHFTNGLKVFTISSDRIAWAQAQTNLGTVYMLRIYGERAANLEEAIINYQFALQVFTRKEFAWDWAKLQANLCNIYINRIQGDKSQNLEAAIDACRAALDIFTKERAPLDWARNHIHLGNIYMERLVGEPAQNLENAIAAFQEAFRIYAKEKGEYPIEWGYAHIALGMAYRKRSQGDLAENSKKAIQAYRNALTMFTLEKYPEEYARVQNNLGNAYTDSPAGERTENIDQAIEAFSAALKVLQRNKYPQRWAMVQNNLGFAYLSRRYGQDNLLAAESAFRLALQVRTRHQLPAEFIRTSRLLGETYYHLENWAEALSQFRQALDAADDLRHLATNVVTHLYISRDMVESYQMAIHTALLLGKTEEAAMLTIDGKSRTLAGRMNAIEVADARLRQPEPALTAQMQQLQDLEKEIKKFNDSDQMRDYLRGRRKELIDRMSMDFPALAPIRYFEPVTVAEIWQQIKASGNLPVLDYVQHVGGCGVFVYAEHKIAYIKLDNTAFQAIANVTAQIQQEKFWGEADYPQQLRRCYDLIFAPVQAVLPETGQLLICPTGSLHQLPFHALLNAQDNYMSDNYAMSFIYSLSMLAILLPERTNTLFIKTGRLLNIAHPGFGSGRFFSQFRTLVMEEMQAVAACFEHATTLFEEQAISTSAIEEANKQTWDVIHINSHGSYFHEDPTRSGLQLQTILTIQDILLQIKLKGKPLVTLSACQSGQMRLQDGEENTGLVSAFLIAGAGAVISSLWKVPVGPTKLLMERFYKLRRGSDRSNAQLIQAAMAEIRAMEPYKNPRCWAAFQLTGLPTT